MQQLGKGWHGKDIIVIYKENDNSILSARGRFVAACDDFITIATAGNCLAISKSAIVKVKLPLEKFGQGGRNELEK